jgi:ubiquinone/menaquinone biosynthesis C-methylase UbiE
LGALLDIGTGTGRMIELFARDAERVSSPSTTVSRCCGSPAPNWAGLPDAASVQAHTEIVLGDFNGLPFADGSFDTILVPPGAPLCPAPRTGDRGSGARISHLTGA